MSLSISNLAVQELPIDELRIEKCHFGKYTNDFSGLVSDFNFSSLNLAVLFGLIFRDLIVKRLIISDTPLEEIEDQVFLGANETLQEIEIYNSRLTTFPKAFAVSKCGRGSIELLETNFVSLQVLGKLVKLKLDKHNITKLEASAFANTPGSQRLERLHISNGNISDVAVEFLQVFASNGSIRCRTHFELRSIFSRCAN